MTYVIVMVDQEVGAVGESEAEAEAEDEMMRCVITVESQDIMQKTAG